ncbi:MAG TPA: hypothetical protein VMT82_04415, partial [candidate division Zixibacteria bacterium]|nr:hypothetical protein [candidate division Zixibacteria bacterium]
MFWAVMLSSASKTFSAKVHLLRFAERFQKIRLSRVTKPITFRQRQSSLLRRTGMLFLKRYAGRAG